LFGGGTQAKPAFGGFGTTPATSAPAFGGFGSTASTQSGGLFGTQAKPAFGGFGGTATATSQPNTGFGGFGQSTGGMFGGAAKPAATAFSFGTSSAAPATGFGGFGATNTGSSLFGNQAKPGGLFGASNTGFGGTSTGGFGNTSFGGGGLNFGGTSTAAAPAAAPSASGSSIQQQLLSLAASPYGENPLFKPLLNDANKRADILKPTNPAAQKALTANTYKVSPHRNVKIKVKPNSGSDRTQIFEGLDDDLLSSGEMFVPRTSVKKLVLRSVPAGENITLSMSDINE